jgi:hydrogenase expression/formation protein HypD
VRFLDEYRNPELARKLVQRINSSSTKPARFMEFCGSHTHAIFKNGIRQLLPPTVELLSGPGCPVCVTSTADLDMAIAMSGIPNVILATFGDMLKVPGSQATLQEAKAQGADVRMVYSTLDALEFARANPERPVVFLGVGFETTAPTVAASIAQAEEQGLSNYYVLSLHKLTPPVTVALLRSGEVRLDGVIAPGHVSAVLGWETWRFLPEEFKIACVVAGFEPLDILLGVERLVEQIETDTPSVESAYMRGVKPQGNKAALKLMYRVFEPGPASWRGVGIVPESGLFIRDEYRRFDAAKVFNVAVPETKENPACLCGEVLRGVKLPTECSLFGVGCTPERPVGPCMVSSEGSCSACYLYGDADGG